MMLVSSSSSASLSDESIGGDGALTGGFEANVPSGLRLRCFLAFFLECFLAESDMHLLLTVFLVDM